MDKTDSIPTDPGTDGHDWRKPENWLFEQASLARKLAPGYCRECDWYHGFYPLLRILGLAATPLRHKDFYTDELARLARQGDYRRILVSGTADTAMPAYVLKIFRNSGLEPEISVLDVCPTPLRLNREYARQCQATMETHAADILQWQPAHTYDLISCHSFLGRFTPEQRHGVVAQWHRLLRKGGKLVTTARIDPGANGSASIYSSDEIESFVQSVMEALITRNDPRLPGSGEAREQAKLYASRVVNYGISSQYELENTLESNGFRIDKLVLREIKGTTANQGLAGTSQTARYAEFVASRI